jgi:hypothetical protein
LIPQDHAATIVMATHQAIIIGVAHRADVVALRLNLFNIARYVKDYQF